MEANLMVCSICETCKEYKGNSKCDLTLCPRISDFEAGELQGMMKVVGWLHKNSYKQFATDADLHISYLVWHTFLKGNFTPELLEKWGIK